LPLTVSCFSKIQIGLPFWYRLTLVVREKGPLNGCVCVYRLGILGNLLRSSMMIGKRFDAYRRVSIEHGTQRLGALRFVRPFQVQLGQFFLEHTINKVSEKMCTPRLMHISRGDLHIYEDEYSLGNVPAAFLCLSPSSLSASQSLCCHVHRHWYAMITRVQISETSQLRDTLSER